MVNKQPTEGVSRVVDTLQVHSVFYTIQGEGPYTGRPAVFVRLAGCNLQCPACDTDYTSQRSTRTIADAVHDVLVCPGSPGFPGLVVVTGGEPCRQLGLVPFCKRLLALGYTVQVETNGTYDVPLPEGVCVVCCPKTHKVNAKMKNRVDFWKYVLSSTSVDNVDGLPVSSLDCGHTSLDGQRVCRPPHDTPPSDVYVQPMDVGSLTDLRYLANVAKAAEVCMRHGYTFQLQTHKYADLP